MVTQTQNQTNQTTDLAAFMMNAGDDEIAAYVRARKAIREQYAELINDIEAKALAYSKDKDAAKAQTGTAGTRQTELFRDVLEFAGRVAQTMEEAPELATVTFDTVLEPVMKNEKVSTAKALFSMGRTAITRIFQPAMKAGKDIEAEISRVKGLTFAALRAEIKPPKDRIAADIAAEIGKHVRYILKNADAKGVEGFKYEAAGADKTVTQRRLSAILDVVKDHAQTIAAVVEKDKTKEEAARAGAGNRIEANANRREPAAVETVTKPAATARKRPH